MRILLRLFLVLVLSAWSAGPGLPANAQGDATMPSVSLDVFRRVPVQESGRIKPVDTYARALLLQLSGKSSYGKESAVDWLAKLLVTPVRAKDDKVFLVNNPEVAYALDITPEPKRRYSYAQLEKTFHRMSRLAMEALQIDEKQRTPVEREFLRLFDNIHIYLGLMSTFQFAEPQPEFEITNGDLKKLMGLPAERTQFSFLDVALASEPLEQITRTLQGKDAKEWNTTEQDVVRLLTNLFQMANLYRNMPFAVIAPFSKGETEWVSPWDAVSGGFQNEDIRREISLLGDFADGYRRGEQAKVDLALNSFIESMKRRMRDNRQVRFTDLEVTYNRLNLFSWAQFFYFVSFLLTLISLIKGKGAYYKFGLGFLVAGMIPHMAALTARMVILARPPVSSLYETFIFVSFMAVIFGIIVEAVNRRQLGLLVAGICGSVFLMIAGKFSMEGDTMKMLVAVLDSNFWLTVHVLHITTGYAACCVAGVLGHIYIFQALLNPKDKKALDVTYRYVAGVLGLGLTLTVFGTALGGVWADQSWGRFWGWDPKENGALLIVLWCAIIFHLRVARLIGPLGFVVGSALVNLVVMWAWFGVNLLSVGLHSYGFMTGVATNLVVYFCVEILFLAVCTPIVYRKIRAN